MVTKERSFHLVQELIKARGPSGQEEEIRNLCYTYLSPYCDEVWVDIAGNLIGKIQGKNPLKPSLRLLAHLDELSLIVKRIEEEGHLRILPLGGIFPLSFGQGPVDILGKKIIPGVVSLGCLHTSEETISVHKTRPEKYQGKGKAAEWQDLFILTRKNEKELKALGVGPGTRVVIGQSRRILQSFEDCWSGYFLDDRAGIATILIALQKLKERKKRPPGDLYIVFTSSEEVGGMGAAYATSTLPGDIVVAVDVGPVAKEYGTVLSKAPIIPYKDTYSLYDKGICDRLHALGSKRGIETQRAIFERYGSDASVVFSRGQAAKAALIAIPTENSHGYEVIHKEAVAECSKLLVSYLVDFI